MTPTQTAILCTVIYVALIAVLAWITRNRE